MPEKQNKKETTKKNIYNIYIDKPIILIILSMSYM